MKRSIYLFLVLMGLFSACKDDETLPANFTLEVRGYSEELIYTYGVPQKVYLWSTKSWADKQISQIEYKVDESVLDKYNEENGTSLKMISEDCYSASKTIFEIDDETRYAKFNVDIDPEKIIAEGGSFDNLEYALAYRIYQNGIPVDDPYGNVIVAFNIKNPVISLSISPDAPKALVDLGEYSRVGIPMVMNFDNKADFDIKVTNDESMTEAYNAEHHTNCNHIAMSDVEFFEDSTTFSKNSREIEIGYYIPRKSIKLGANVLPIKLANLPSYVNADPSSEIAYYKFDYTPKMNSALFHVINNPATQEGSTDYITDNNLTSGSYWHANWRNNGYVPLPLDLDFGFNDEATATIQGFIYYGRQGNTWGNTGPKHIQVYTSMDNENWDLQVDSELQIVENPGASKPKPYQGPQQFLFSEPVEAKYFRLRVTEKYDDGIAICEVYLLGETK